MINGILNGILNFVFGLISILLTPIDTLISSSFPSFTQILTDFGNFITQILGVIPWVLSWFNIPVALLAFVAYYAISKITVSIVVHEIKLILAWYRKLVP